jgi:hypothetical protein
MSAARQVPKALGQWRSTEPQVTAGAAGESRGWTLRSSVLAASTIDAPRPSGPASAACFMLVPARPCWHLGCSAVTWGSAVKRDYADSSRTACNGWRLLWVLRRLIASAADESAFLYRWHFLIAAWLLAASAVLIVSLSYPGPPGFFTAQVPRRR